MGEQLVGCRIVLTAQRRSAELAAALERRGASVVHAAAITIVPHVDDDQLVAQTRALIADPPSVVVVTTGAGFTGWIEAADAAGLQQPLHHVLQQARIVARGPKARGAIQAADLVADWVAETETDAELRDFLLAEGVAGERIAVQHHGSGSDGLDEAFASAGADVVPLVVYRWGPPPDRAALRNGIEILARKECDAVAFTSAPGVVAFFEAAEQMGLLQECVDALTGPVVAATVGDVTASPLRDKGIDPLVPDRFRLGAMVRGLVIELGERRGITVRTAAGLLRVLRSVAIVDGQVLALSPVSLAVLRVLAEAGGGVVTREQILAAMPGESTDLHAAEVAVARLREAIGRRDLVATVVKRGYRLEVATDGSATGSAEAVRTTGTTG